MQFTLLNTSQHEQALRWWRRTGSASASRHADIDGVSKRNQLQQMQGAVTSQSWCKLDQHCCWERCFSADTGTSASMHFAQEVTHYMVT